MKDSILIKKKLSFYRYFKARWVQVTLLGMENMGKRVRKQQISKINKCEVFPCTWGAHHFSPKEFLRLSFFLSTKEEKSGFADCIPKLSYKFCFFSTVEAGLPFLKEKKTLEGFELKVALWDVHETGLDDILFKCLLSVPNTSVSVTFLGCCSWDI